MANINLQKFTGDLIDDFRDRTEKLNLGEQDVPVAMALLAAITTAATRLVDGGASDPRQLALPLTRGQKAARTRKRNAAKAKGNSGASADSATSGASGGSTGATR